MDIVTSLKHYHETVVSCCCADCGHPLVFDSKKREIWENSTSYRFSVRPCEKCKKMRINRIEAEGQFTTGFGESIDPGMRVYISGPMTGVENHNQLAFEDAEKYLRIIGAIPINPHKFPVQESYEDYLQFDLEVIATAADAIALLPGWENSPGAKKELKTALELGLDVLLLQEKNYETL